MLATFFRALQRYRVIAWLFLLNGLQSLGSFIYGLFVNKSLAFVLMDFVFGAFFTLWAWEEFEAWREEKRGRINVIP